MSFFTKAIGNTGRFFTKGIKPMGVNFFRKGGGLDGLSRGLRQSSNVIRGLGGGIKQLSQNPVVQVGGNVLGTYLMGNPLLGTQLGVGGQALGSAFEEGSDLLKAGREITNRNKYMSAKQQQDENDMIARAKARRQRNILERQLPSVPNTVPVMKQQQPIMRAEAMPISVAPAVPIYSTQSLNPYGDPNVNFSFA